jgi:hypothetical protein
MGMEWVSVQGAVQNRPPFFLNPLHLLLHSAVSNHSILLGLLCLSFLLITTASSLPRVLLTV